MRVGILVVATGRYASYLPALAADCKQHLLAEHDRTLFAFTDAASTVRSAAGFEVVHIETAHAPWPAPTLHRYHYFCSAHEALACTDVLFYLDADTRIVARVGDEILPDPSHALVAVMHPGFCGRFAEEKIFARALRALGSPRPRRRWLEGPLRGSYETRPESTAYVGPSEGQVYYMGGFNGGRTADFLHMARTIRERIDRDAERGIIAVWHDESHLNRFLIDHPPKVLSPSYGFPERWNLPFEPRILLLDKDHEAMRAPLTP